MGLLLEFASIDILVDLFFRGIIIPLVQNISPVHGLLVSEIGVFVTAFKLIVRLIGMIVHIVIIVVYILPRKLSVRFLKQSVIQIQASLPLSILHLIRHELIQIFHLIVTFHISIHIIVAVLGCIDSALEMSEQNVLTTPLV